jgi:hypothetical protein
MEGMKKYAIFFAATGPVIGRNYLPDTNCLLNSIQKHQLHKKLNGTLDVYLMHYGFERGWNYIEKAKKVFDFNFIGIELNPSSIPCKCETKPIELIKRARYFKILEIGKQYDAVCLLDADMFFVSPVFSSFFEMVSGTNKIIGANERFKWAIGSDMYFESDGKSIFTESTKMYSMICNVPSIFDMNKWNETFEYYCKICFGGYQFKGKERVGIGDLFAYNIAINKTGRANDVIMFPMETMAQVHHVWRKPWTYLINDNDYWMTFSGDRVYMIHDTKRICRQSFIQDNMKDYNIEFEGWKDREKFTSKIEQGLRSIQIEWWNLNFGKDAKLNLYDFLPNNDEWNKLKGK